jgi:spermidine/putrescine transport system substrate-binding protein
MIQLKTVLLGATCAAAFVAGNAFFAPQPAQAEPTLNLFIWSDYIPESLITEFEMQCGCAVNETDYDSNSEMEAKLKAGGDSEFDVIVPSSYYVARLAAEGLIQPLDHSQIPNIKNLYTKFQSPSYDPGDKYSIPYQWGTTGVGYLKDNIKDPAHSWGLLFDPTVNTTYPFTLMSGSGQDTIGAACAYLGYGFDCDTQAQWVAAAKLVKQTMARKNGVQRGCRDELCRRLRQGYRLLPAQGRYRDLGRYDGHPRPCGQSATGVAVHQFCAQRLSGRGVVEL